ncbi:MAG TPA: Gfo/Idh/MocA family oxidoreductase [Firmicutes bacterium]|nr:Gfo/Idh/MocA family oxidoreductase [Bacillota bacterium]
MGDNHADKVLRVAMVGCGNHAKHHFRSIEALKPSIKLVATIDVHPERARMAAEKYGAERWSTDYEKELAAGDIDAVILSLPHHLHAPYTVAACEAGVHVLCEKPMARNIDEGRKMKEAADQAGVCLMIAFNQRFDASALVAKEMLAAGEIGPLHHLSMDYMVHVIEPSTTWRRSVEETGGFMLPLIGSHGIDLMLYLSDTQPRRVYCEMAHFSSNWEGEDEVAIVMALADQCGVEIPATVRVSAHCRQKRTVLTIAGAEHTLAIERNQLLMDGKEIALPELPGDCFYRQMEYFRDAALGRKPAISAGDDALRTLTVIDSAFRSVKEQQPVRL